MAGGFESAFKAFIQSQQSSSSSDNSVSSDEDKDSYEDECDMSKPSVNIEQKDVINNNAGNNNISPENHRPIPKLKLVVDPDYASNENLSPFSLKRYIKSPNSHFVKLDSYTNSVRAKSSSNCLNVTQKNYNEDIKKRLSDTTISEKNKKVLFPSTEFCKSLKRKDTIQGRLKCSYQAQIVLKKYGLQYPACKRKFNSKSLKIYPEVNSLSRDIKFNQLLHKDTVHVTVNKTECDSHYFCSQGEGLSRNSPEAAKSVISSPANASVGESSLTDASVFPMYDPTLAITTAFDTHECENEETHRFVTNDAISQPEKTDSNHRHNSSLQESVNSDIDYICESVPKVQTASEMISKKCRRFTVGAEKETDFTDIVSQHISSQYGSSLSTSDRYKMSSDKRKRNHSEIQTIHNHEFVYDKLEEETSCSERKKRTRSRRNSSCLCCLSKSPKYKRKSLIKCNISDFKYLSSENQKFIELSVQLSNIQSKLHLLFCSVFPKLLPILSNINPESQQFQQIIDDILQTLQTSEDQELQNDTVSVVSMFEDLHLKQRSQVVPIFDASVQLCQNPEYCLDLFRDKVISLLQLLLPSLIISLDSFISNTKELDKFLDKVISSNCVK